MEDEERPSVGDYFLLRTIGLGSSAKVKLGEHKTNGTKVAIKIIKKSKFDSKPGLKTKIQREISLMRIFDHPHLLKLLDVCETEERLYLVLEYAANGELFDYLAQVGSLSAQLALKFFHQIVYGLEFLHTYGICHRDLKPENILMDENNNVKIGDFGFARWMRTNIAETSCGSPHYTAPEIIKGDPYDGRAADVWSLGVIFYTFLCGRRPFEDPTLRNLLTKIRTADYKMPNFPDEIKDLISRMLCVEADKRITIEQIKTHPAFRLLLPPDYVFPAPLPAPNIIESIDPALLSPSIIAVLQQIGFKDDDLRDQLMADHSTMAKTFLFLMLRRLSFDSLPWGDDEQPVVSLDITPDTVLGFNYPSQYLANIVVFQEREIDDIVMRYDNAVTMLQKYLTECEFLWYYPHDELIMARRLVDGTDIVIRIVFLGNEKLKLIASLVSGDALALPPLIDTLGKLLR